MLKKMTPQLRDFAKRYTAAWCSGDPLSVASHFAPNGSLSVNSNPPAIGADAIAATAQSFMTAFPDLQVYLDDLRQEGDRIAYHWTLTGTYAANGNSVRISGFELWRMGPDGLIADSAGQFDSSDYERQILAPSV
jgi:uncharacterized protein (TIGR02246 family)